MVEPVCEVTQAVVAVMVVVVVKLDLGQVLAIELELLGILLNLLNFKLPYWLAKVNYRSVFGVDGGGGFVGIDSSGNILLSLGSNCLECKGVNASKDAKKEANLTMELTFCNIESITCCKELM